MRPKERRHEPNTRTTRESRDESKKTELALDREGVARFHLDRGRPPSAHSFQPGAGDGENLLVRGPARGSHGRVNSAAGPRDRGIPPSSDLERELERAIARIEDVRVRIDEPGDDGSAPRRIASAAGTEANVPRYVPFAAHPDESAIRDGERGVRNRSEFTGLLPHARDGTFRQGGEFADARDQEVGVDHGW